MRAMRRLDGDADAGPKAGDGAQLATRLLAKYPDRISGAFVLPGHAGAYEPLPDDLPPALARALRARGIAQLYAHQGEAWRASRAGSHVLVVTPTASGKTLCYTLPVLASAMQASTMQVDQAQARGKALYLFPTKALAQDQVAELLEINRAGDLGVRAFTFDGDTPGRCASGHPPAWRHRGQQSGHAAPGHPAASHQVGAVLREPALHRDRRSAHLSRACSAAHVANLMRRLKRICAFYGVVAAVHPVLGDHRQSGRTREALIELPVHAITESRRAAR
jgi:DEAD/DEAH box helicase domain-containing protein